MRSLPLLLLPVLSLPLLAQETPRTQKDWAEAGMRKTVTEPRSGIQFPVVLPAAGTKNKHLLVGAGLRTKTIFGIKVYAMGFYLDPDRAGSELVQFKQTNSKRLAKDGMFYKKLMDAKLDKSIRLVMARDVDAEDMREAFDDSLRPAVRKVASGAEQEGGMEALKKFRSLFKEELRKGDELVFSMVGGVLYTTHNRRELGPIQSPTLGRALFEIYLGQDPVSSKARKNFYAGLPQFFERVQEYRRLKNAGVQSETGGEVQSTEDTPAGEVGTEGKDG